jgi:hypothetical protein
MFPHRRLSLSWIEVRKPLCLRLAGRELHLRPGEPVELSDDQARRLLAKAPDLVHVVAAPSPAWLAAWRTLAALVSGIAREDPRYEPVAAALDRCDDAYLAGDWPGFEQAAQRVRETLIEREPAKPVATDKAS